MKRICRDEALVQGLDATLRLRSSVMSSRSVTDDRIVALAMAKPLETAA